MNVMSGVGRWEWGMILFLDILSQKMSFGYPGGNDEVISL